MPRTPRDKELPGAQEPEAHEVARQGDRIGADGPPHGSGTGCRRADPGIADAREAQRDEEAPREREEDGVHTRVSGCHVEIRCRVVERGLVQCAEDPSRAGHAPGRPQIEREEQEESLGEHDPGEGTVLEPPEIAPRFTDARPGVANLTHVPLPMVPG